MSKRLGSLTLQQREILSVLGFLFLEHDRPDRAAILYGALVQSYPDNGYFLKCLAYALLRDEEFDRALAAAEAGLGMGLSAGDVDFLQLVRGRALWNLGQREEARLAIRGVLDRRRRARQDGS